MAEITGLPFELFENAACLDDPDALFVDGAAQHDAKLICRPCPAILECLATALDRREEYGVWGGMTDRERRALLRRRPGVTSWRRELARHLPAPPPRQSSS